MASHRFRQWIYTKFKANWYVSSKIVAKNNTFPKRFRWGILRHNLYTLIIHVVKIKLLFGSLCLTQCFVQFSDELFLFNHRTMGVKWWLNWESFQISRELSMLLVSFITILLKQHLDGVHIIFVHSNMACNWDFNVINSINAYGLFQIQWKDPSQFSLKVNIFPHNKNPYKNQPDFEIFTF